MGGERGTIAPEYLALILTAILVGTLARLLTLKIDYRQYPSHPNGYMIHLVIGFIAASLGAFAVPAVMTGNYTAVTFLTLALQQFRDVRRMEKESLKDLESTEFTPRGDAYIDGIAKTFESRNYIALLVSLTTGATIEATKFLVPAFNLGLGVLAGGAVFLILRHFSQDKTVGDIAHITLGKIEIRKAELYVDDIFVSNLIGTKNAQDLLSMKGLAAVIEPNAEHYRIALDNFGQRKAILFEATRSLGVKRYHFTRKDFATGKTVIVFVPIIKDEKKLIRVIENTPLLESVKKSHALLNRGVLGGDENGS